MPSQRATKVELRHAELADAPALADLITQLGYPSRPEQVAARLHAVLPGDQGLLLAEADGRVVGFVHVSPYRSLVVDGTAEILAFVVESKYRSQGIGRTLLQAAEEWAREKGCSRLQLRTNIIRERAHQFYFRNGFRQVKTSLTLVKDL